MWYSGKYSLLKALCALSLMGSFSSVALAHPTGNLIVVGGQAYWSYVDPIDDPQHHACIMHWEPEASAPSVLLKSRFPGSDFMLANRGLDLYFLERRQEATADIFLIRLWKMEPGALPVVIWDWREDSLRMGEGGFHVLSEEEIIFARYPSVYRIHKGESPRIAFDPPAPVNRLRSVDQDAFLLLGEGDCWWVALDGTVLQRWTDLLDPVVDSPPLNRNRIFDLDYQAGELLLAYWGKRAFVIVHPDGRKESLIQQTAPLAPHWVAYLGKDKLLFASELIFDGRNPQPFLIRWTAERESEIIWEN